MERKQGLNSKVRWTVGISCLVTVAVLTLVSFNVKTMLDLQAQVSKAQLRMSRFNRLVTFVVDMETGERGFMLSGEMSYLEPYNIAEVEFEKYARETEAMVLDEAKQSERLKEIVALKGQWIEGPAVQEMMARRKVNAGLLNQQEFISVFKASNGKALTDQIRSKAFEAITEEEQRIRGFQEKTSRSAKRIVLWSIAALFCVLTGFGSIVWVTNRLAKSILKLIADLTGVTDSLRKAAGQIADASDQLLKAGEQQSSSIQLTASSVEQMSSMAGKTATNARRSEEIATVSKDKVNKGKGSTEEMIHAIEQIHESNAKITHQVEESNRNIEGLVDVISEIGNKARVINDIVFQTKLLSFNASVEAARAGEHGKGFSVVAEEVGTLAKNSGDAAREIDQMLGQGLDKAKSVIEKTKKAVGAIIVENQEKVSAGVEIAKQCGLILEEILSNTNEVHGAVAEISSAMSEQNTGVLEINRAIHQIDELTMQNNQTSADTEKSAKLLLAQAEKLGEVVLSLSVEMHGSQKKPQAA